MAVLFVLFAVLLTAASVKSDCELEAGVVIKDGKTFVFPHEKCVTYMCKGEHFTMSKAGCENDGACVDLNALVTKEGCIVYKCQKNITSTGKLVGFFKYEVMCVVGNECKANGDTFQKDGKNCKCVVTDETMTYSIKCD